MVAVATTKNREDDAVVELCRSIGVAWYRGSSENVLERYYEAAEEFGADIIVRVTSDCPLIDPVIIDRCIEALQNSGADYVSNVIPERTFPRGLDVEAFSLFALERAYRQAAEIYEKEHVTPYIWENKKTEFVAGPTIRATSEYARNYRLAVDYPQDFELMEKLYKKFYRPGSLLNVPEILSFLDQNPDWIEINAGCEQKPLK